VRVRPGRQVLQRRHLRREDAASQCRRRVVDAASGQECHAEDPILRALRRRAGWMSTESQRRVRGPRSDRSWLRLRHQRSLGSRSEGLPHVQR